MTDKRRCISCESLKDKDKFDSAHFRLCKACTEHPTDEELRYFENIFLDCGQELFCLEYPDAQSQLGITIPSDKEGKKSLIQNIKKRIEDKIEFWTKERENSNSESKTLEANVSLHQLSIRKAEALGFEKRYNK